MILNYLDVTGPEPEVLDTVTVEGDNVEYDTGLAQALIEQYTGLAGSLAEAIDVLRDWSNGYVATRAEEDEGP